MGMGKIASSLLNPSKVIEDCKNWLSFTNGRHITMSDVITCYLEKKMQNTYRQDQPHYLQGPVKNENTGPCSKSRKSVNTL